MSDENMFALPHKKGLFLQGTEKFIGWQLKQNMSIHDNRFGGSGCLLSFEI